MGSEVSRPPEPLRPWWIWLEDRRHEIELTIDRYTAAKAPLCPWWLIERGLINLALLLHPRSPWGRSWR